VNKIIAFQISFLVVFVPSYLFFSRPKSPAVLSKKAEATQTPTPTSTPKPTETSTPKPTIAATQKPTLAPTPIPVPKYTSEQVHGFVERFAGQYGVDPNVLRALAICETDFNPEAISPNGFYYGLFQFGSTTWQNLRKEMGENSDPNLRLDAEEAAQTAAYAVSKGKRGMWPECNP